MANTYSQLYFHVVFAVKGRQSIISKSWKDELYKYISGIISNKNQKLIIINGMPDHIHLLIGTKPDCNLSELVRDIKANSGKWVNETNLIKGRFDWQIGFGAFTVSQSQLNKLVNYIKSQEEHHKKTSFRNEFESLLKNYKIDYKEEYLFDDFKEEELC